MQQQISVITLGISDLVRSRRFYAETPVSGNDEIIFYQMNGFVLGTWLQKRLEADMRRDRLCRPGAFALAHNVPSQNEVLVVMNWLTLAGGRMLREGDAPPHGGFRGYVADPNDQLGRSPGTRPGQLTIRVW